MHVPQRASYGLPITIAPAGSEEDHPWVDIEAAYVMALGEPSARARLREYPRAPEEPLFPGRSGAPLTRIGLTERLKLAVQGASRQFPELARRRISPHIIRHCMTMPEAPGVAGCPRSTFGENAFARIRSSSLSATAR
ncbi:protein of unknown function (plasmid) [Cupriavidus taiwanensis]|uniref:Uncharacterized protein n=1 Tax=Cupriavidus taiwanensis TaxID=164546 RepID=A0A375EC38_9BURK|nr:protein of unknown function [Cupriavidus taiwanensis]SOZ72326.1 protein of unknown function [Cupriavidus taiwanensis]SOZ74617.1 protein of unknown function [Cupriavidus taiwanensis]SPA11432.1 protein of unknown function [Cupriavidus taiwanensis]